MKIVAISDTHTKHAGLVIPTCDVLVHAGDFSWMGGFDEVSEFAEWFRQQPAKYKVCIAGNHERALDKTMGREFDPSCRDILAKDMDPTVFYLEDSGVVLDGVKFYGTPWTPAFYDWGFNAYSDCDLPFNPGCTSLSERYGQIPDDVDVLICHGPPYGLVDVSNNGDVCTGSPEMRNLIDAHKNLKLYLCGHIHESRGLAHTPETNVPVVNVSSLDRDYETLRKPVVIHLDDKEVKSVNI